MKLITTIYFLFSFLICAKEKTVKMSWIKKTDTTEWLACYERNASVSNNR